MPRSMARSRATLSDPVGARRAASRPRRAHRPWSGRRQRVHLALERRRCSTSNVRGLAVLEPAGRASRRRTITTTMSRKTSALTARLRRRTSARCWASRPQLSPPAQAPASRSARCALSVVDGEPGGLEGLGPVRGGDGHHHRGSPTASGRCGAAGRRARRRASGGGPRRRSPRSRATAVLLVGLVLEAVTPGRPSAWSRAVPLKMTTAPQSGRTTHARRPPTGRASPVRATQSSPAGGAVGVPGRICAHCTSARGPLGRGAPTTVCRRCPRTTTPTTTSASPAARPLPPDDRLWRHPRSWPPARCAPRAAPPRVERGPPPRGRWRCWAPAGRRRARRPAVIAVTGSLSPRVVERAVIEKVAVAAGRVVAAARRRRGAWPTWRDRLAPGDRPPRGRPDGDGWRPAAPGSCSATTGLLTSRHVRRRTPSTIAVALRRRAAPRGRARRRRRAHRRRRGRRSTPTDLPVAVLGDAPWTSRSASPAVGHRLAAAPGGDPVRHHRGGQRPRAPSRATARRRLLHGLIQTDAPSRRGRRAARCRRRRAR